MAIKIAGTEVINGSRAVVNMSNIEGKYSQFHGSATIITTVLDMSKPIMRRTLSAPTTFTASNIATGKCAILMLDVSTSGHLPTFPSSIQWPGDGTEPDWDATGVQHWLVGFTCWDNTTIRATATGWGTGSGTPANDMEYTLTVGTYGATATALQGKNDGGTGSPNGAPAFGSLDSNAVPTGVYSDVTYGGGLIRSMTFRDGYLYMSNQQDDEFWLQFSGSQYFPNQAPTTSGDGTGWSILTWDTDSDSTNGAQVQSRSASTYSTFMSGSTFVTQWKRSYSGSGSGGGDSPRNPFIGQTGGGSVKMTFT
jgi:hypothetical protein